MSPTNGLQIHLEVSHLEKEEGGWLGSSQGS